MSPEAWCILGYVIGVVVVAVSSGFASKRWPLDGFTEFMSPFLTVAWPIYLVLATVSLPLWGSWRLGRRLSQ